MADINDDINQIIQNASNLKLDKLVGWMVQVLEFDQMLACIHENLKLNIKQEQLVSDILSIKENVILSVNHLVPAESKYDIVLYIMSRIRNKRFILIDIQNSTPENGYYNLLFLNHDKIPFTVPFNIFVHILRNINELRDCESHNEYTIDLREDIIKNGGKLPFYYSSLVEKNEIIYDNNAELDPVWKKVIKHLKSKNNEKIELSIPRLLNCLDVSEENTYKFNKDNLVLLDNRGNPIPNIFHIPGSWGIMDNVYGEEKGYKMNEIIKCQQNALTSKVKLSFGLQKRSPKMCFGKSRYVR